VEYEAVIGLEVHAELLTQTKMFCACPVLDTTLAEPNTAVCPVCAGMPGVLPVTNRMAVEYGLRVALALGCQVQRVSIFERKNYFYPDLPKGYQISQYEHPLAVDGCLPIETSTGQRVIRIRRVHLEEDTGKLTHINGGPDAHSLINLNRAGVPLLEIVTEPDMHTVEEVRAYATSLRLLLRTLGVNSGDMQKGVIRFEANVSIRPAGSQELGTRVEIKNLNSFRALERSVIYQIEQQRHTLEAGGKVAQETLGWDEATETTYSQRSKEDAHDYRYFPEPDLPPVIVEAGWVEAVRSALPELPRARIQRLQQQYGITASDAHLMVEESGVADYFEAAASAGQAHEGSPGLSAVLIANWLLGEVFGYLNASGESLSALRVPPAALAELLGLLSEGAINAATAKTVLVEMLQSGRGARQIVAERGLQQISDGGQISAWVRQTLDEHPAELNSYLQGKESLSNWFFGQVMRAAAGRGDPRVIRAELERQLKERQKG